MPFRFTLKTSSQSSSLSSTKDPFFMIPALFTSTSIRPNAATATSTNASLSDRFETSAIKSKALIPLDNRDWYTSSRLSGLVSLTTRRAPSSPHRSAMALPIPLPLPVTTTAKSFSLKMDLSSQRINLLHPKPSGDLAFESLGSHSVFPMYLFWYSRFIVQIFQEMCSPCPIFSLGKRIHAGHVKYHRPISLPMFKR